MAAYLIQRLFQALLLLVAISMLVFVVPRLAPGDPATLLVDPAFFTPQQLAELRASLGLDEPWPSQYTKTMRGLLFGELRSFRTQQSTIAMVLEALPTTLLVVAGGVVLALVSGGLLGVLAAYRQNSPTDYALSASTVLAISLPPFVLAMLLIRVLAEELRWLPASGIRPPGVTQASLLQMLPHLVLPWIVTAFPIGAIVARYTRDAAAEALQEDFVRTARAKGLRAATVLARHVLPNALVPVLSLLGSLVPLLLGGSVIVETLFGLPGLGRITVQAALQRDYPVVMTTTLISAVLVIAGSLLTDLAYRLADPRMRAV